MIKLHFPINRIEFWPFQIRWFCLGFVFFLVFFLGYLFAVEIEFTDLKKAQSQQAQLKQQVMQGYSDLKNIHLYEAKLATLKTIFNTPYPRVLSQSESSSIINTMLEEANSSGVTIKTFNRLPVIKKDFYSEEIIQIDLSGSYYNFALFCNALISLKIVVVLTDFNITLNPAIKNVQENPDLEVNLNLHLYYPNITFKDEPK
jgi:Tfp pilus assembly protein PilO